LIENNVAAHPTRVGSVDQDSQEDAMRGKITWIVAADGKRAVFFENHGVGKGVQPLDELNERHDVPRSHEIMSDRQGHMRGGPAAAGSGAMLPRNDPHEFEEKRFEEHVAQELDAAAQAKRFDRLIIAAPPRALGNIREALSKQTRALVIAEYDKDFTKSSIPDLAEHLKDHLAV
jgi:protein required for attachment to host cells